MKPFIHDDFLLETETARVFNGKRSTGLLGEPLQVTVEVTAELFT